MENVMMDDLWMKNDVIELIQLTLI